MAARGCCSCCCRPTVFLLILVSAIPLALIASLERASPSYRYQSGGWLRECAKWDSPRSRFLVSTFADGGVAEVVLPRSGAKVALKERMVILDADVAGNGSLGITVDLARGRLLVVYADLREYRFGAVAAYDLDSYDRLFLTVLSGADDEPTFADDVAVDDDGNAYITAAKANKIWKVGLNGELVSVIRSNMFIQRKEWYYNFVGLNGIVYHPNGYLLVIHTSSGYLFKVDTLKEKVSVVNVEGSLHMGDGMELVSPTKLVVAGSTATARVVESSDDWSTAKVTERYTGPLHRVATAVTMKDGKACISHILGGRTHLITEATFTPLIAE